jgi:hypothetical protein
MTKKYGTLGLLMALDVGAVGAAPSIKKTL